MPGVCGLLCTAVILVSQPFPFGEEEILSYLPDGKCLVTRLSSDALQRSPPWRAAEANPPLAARSALALAEREKSKLVKDTAGGQKWVWYLEGAILVPREKDRWYWLIEYWAIPDQGGFTGRPANLSLVVLMDGTLVQPEVRDRNEGKNKIDKGGKKKGVSPASAK